MAKLSHAEADAIFSRCERFLTHHTRKYPCQVLAELSEQTGEIELPDIYGKGPLIEDFEKEVAALLGKEAAVFMPSGTMAQPIALRIWADQAQNHHFGLHPTSHLENHEHHSYRHLHGLEGVLLGDKAKVLAFDDLKECQTLLSSLIIELPHRDLGGELPPWQDLEKMSAHCKEKGIRFHLDGARLWESLPYYQKSPAEICALFDSVYVSFYKGLGGIAGAILAGPKDFIETARIWQRRQGGNLISLYPYVVSARSALKRRLPRMQTYHDHAVAIANALRPLSEIEITPSQPHTNMMHLVIAADAEKLEEAFVELARDRKIAFFQWVQSLDKGKAKLELTVGDATMDFTPAEIAGIFRDCIKKGIDRSESNHES